RWSPSSPSTRSTRSRARRPTSAASPPRAAVSTACVAASRGSTSRTASSRSPRPSSRRPTTTARWRPSSPTASRSTPSPATTTSRAWRATGITEHDPTAGDGLPDDDPLRMSEAEFEEAVADALDLVPQELLDLMDNVVVLVEDEPPPEEEPDLLGLYDGTPLTERDLTWGGTLPDRIFIFRGPTLRM